MKITGQAVVLRVFVGESDKSVHLPLYEAIIKMARDADLVTFENIRVVNYLPGK